MKLICKIVKDSRIIKETVFEKTDESVSFHDLLEEAYIAACRELNIPVPLWLKKNTKEFGAYRKTFFSKEQFLEEVDFDRFELRIEM